MDLFGDQGAEDLRVPGRVGELEVATQGVEQPPIRSMGFAVEGLSEALHYEVEAFGVRVKIVEPGMIKTDFGGRSFDFCNDASLTEYQGTVQKLFAHWGKVGSNPSDPRLVAEVIWEAAHDETGALRFRAGADAEALLEARKQQDDATFIGALKAQIGLGSG